MGAAGCSAAATAACLEASQPTPSLAVHPPLPLCLLRQTLKYFWLLQSPDSALDLSQWVLNTEAHPLRIAKLPLTTATMS